MEVFNGLNQQTREYLINLARENKSPKTGCKSCNKMNEKAHNDGIINIEKLEKIVHNFIKKTKEMGLNFRLNSSSVMVQMKDEQNEGKFKFVTVKNDCKDEELIRKLYEKHPNLFAFFSDKKELTQEPVTKKKNKTEETTFLENNIL